MIVSSTILNKIETLSRYNQVDFESLRHSPPLSNLLNALFQELSSKQACSNDFSLLKTNLTIIKARLKKSDACDSEEVTALRQKIKAISTLLKPPKQSKEESVNKDVALTPVINGYFLGFSNTLAESIDDTALQMTLSSLDQKKRANIIYFNFSACPKLTKDAIIHLLHYCPKLQHSSFATVYATSRFLDHTLKIQDETIGVNTALFSHYAPNIIGSGFKENKEGCTVIEETSPQALKDLLNALVDPTWIDRQQECERLIELLMLAERFLLTDITKSCENALLDIFCSLNTHELDQSALTTLNNTLTPYFTLNRFQSISRLLQMHGANLILDTVTSVEDLRQAFESDCPMNRTQILLQFAKLALGMDRGGSKILEQLHTLAKQYTSDEEYVATKAKLQKIGYEQFENEFLSKSNKELIVALCDPRSLASFLQTAAQDENLLDFTPNSKIKIHLESLFKRLVAVILYNNSHETAFPTTLVWFLDFLEQNGWDRFEIHLARGLLNLNSWQDQNSALNAAKESFEKALTYPSDKELNEFASSGLFEAVLLESSLDDLFENISEILDRPQFESKDAEVIEIITKFYLALQNHTKLSPELYENEAELGVLVYATGIFGIEKNLEKARHFFDMTSIDKTHKLYPILSDLVTHPITLEQIENVKKTEAVQMLLLMPFSRVVAREFFEILEDEIQKQA